jgi:hypothetical protein
MPSALVPALLIATASVVSAQTSGPEWATRLVHDVTGASFPELLKKDIRVKQFVSPSDYFQARFSIVRLITGRRMQYVIHVNSAVALASAPDEGNRAIIAHELAHVAYYARGNRLRLFGLIQLASGRFREHFEKSADMEALRRGYAQGLKQYRLWLYQHVPGDVVQQKKADYLTPDEIDAIQRQMGR